ncbi:MAG: putative manganese transporter [Tractidigestivibacter sp.]|uniref:putative manganese transporter n=1 Tax=Tractidigestivibacter sp. TaxID=2847320 RepID=UPI003D8E0178
MNLFVDVLIDSAIDTLELVPFLFLTYLAMEALEHTTSGKMERLVSRAGHYGPLIGGALGVLPQCGFSAMAATLYSAGIVTVGTLMAVILSTSDELIPVFIAHQEPVPQLLKILAVKMVMGIVVGLVVDLVLRALRKVDGIHPHIHDLCERSHCHCDEEGEGREEAGRAGHAGHDHGHGHGKLSIVRAAAIHTVQVLGFIFLITLLFGLLIEGVGQDTVASLVSQHPVRATLVAALVGLIPNCGASVTIAELYLDGVLAAGPMMAGLLSAGGVGLLVLYRTNPHPRENIAITLAIYAVSVLAGLVVSASGMLF